MTVSQTDITDVMDLVTNPVPEDLPDPHVQKAVDRFQGILASENVVGVGLARKVRAGIPLDKLSMSFYVKSKRPAYELGASELIPMWVPSVLSPLSAIATDVFELGEVTLEVLGNTSGREIQPGHSISRLDSSPGTLGAMVQLGSSLAVLSNSHVLALSGRGKVGDGILYPGAQDGGQVPQSLIATLAVVNPFIPGGAFVNTVDCAVARILPSVAGEAVPSILGIGLPAGTAAAQLGTEVIKLGRTTGLTTGTVLDVNFRFAMNYPGVGSVGFTDQVLCTPYSQGGDSGSLVLDSKTKAALGLHFAGSVNGSIFCPISPVLASLGVTLVT